MTIPQARLGFRFRRLIVVHDRLALDEALAQAPRRIVVEGDEALRAHAASLAYASLAYASLAHASMPTAHAMPETPAGGAPGTMSVPALGRIGNGYRHRPRPDTRRRRLGAGMAPVLVAALGLLAALTVEMLSFPQGDPLIVHGSRQPASHLVRSGLAIVPPTEAPQPAPGAGMAQIAIPGLSVLAICALAYVAWQAAGIGRPARITWRVEKRIPGRLVIARVRTPLG